MGWFKSLKEGIVGGMVGSVFGVGGSILGALAGSGVGKAPKVKGFGTNPAAETAAAETAAAQQAMMATGLKRRLRRASMLTAAGSTKSAAAPALSSVFSYGKTMTGE